MCVKPQNRKKIHKNFLIWHSGLLKVIAFGADQKPVYDFLLVVNSNLGNRFWDSDLLAKSCKFFLPPSFCAVTRADFFQIFGKALLVLKLESSRQSTKKIYWS